MSPFEDERWVRDNFDAIYRYVTTEAVERDRTIDERHRELMQVHRDGWKQMAGAVVKMGELIAGAIRDTCR